MRRRIGNIADLLRIVCVNGLALRVRCIDRLALECERTSGISRFMAVNIERNALAADASFYVNRNLEIVRESEIKS